MLKIKDNVDLKELEKFGFEKFENGCKTIGWSNQSSQIKKGKLRYINIIEKDNEFNGRYERTIPDFVGLQDLLYDLIKADLVEKVEE